MPPEENKTQDTSQQETAQVEPVVETLASVEQSIETTTEQIKVEETQRKFKRK